MMFRNITSCPSQHYVLMQKGISVLSSDVCKKEKNTLSFVLSMISLMFRSPRAPDM